MKLGIRAKLIGNMVIAAALPLTVAIVTLLTVGYRYQVHERGDAYHNEAQHVAQNLRLITECQVDSLRVLLDQADMGRLVQQQGAPGKSAGVLASMNDIAAIEQRWPALAPDGPELRPLLQNPLAARLRHFQTSHPHFAEMLLTDAGGRLIAATQKSSDYFQADEAWWQRAVHLKRGEVWIEGLAFDASAGVVSLDVCLPVWPEGGSGVSPPSGVLKAVMNVSTVFGSIPYLLSDQQSTREVVDSDGRVLLRLRGHRFEPGDENIPPAAMRKLNERRDGWVKTPWNGGRAQMTGITPLRLLGGFSAETPPRELQSLFVVVRDDADSVLKPIRQQLIWISALGALLGFGFVGFGIHMSGRHFLRPLETLRAAAQAVTATVRSGGGGESSAGSTSAGIAAAEKVRQAGQIRTGDELEELARDFSGMAERLLHYQVQLETEVAAKTAEIQSDLAMARDFQQALLPRDYPPIPSIVDGKGISLDFHHIYRPAAALGGDFFDVIKIDDHRAGVIIADVMGHGTRSALVTAILRALMHETAGKSNDPGLFLSVLNRAFHGIVRQTGQVVFVSAVYMIIDTKEGTLSCASAGHPSPLLANRRTREIGPIFTHLGDNPALGLFPESCHTVFTHKLREQDIIFLFTDGIVEATNAGGQEFGNVRLAGAIHSHMDQELPLLIQSVVKTLGNFIGESPLQDDICLVGVEAMAHRVL